MEIMEAWHFHSHLLFSSVTEGKRIFILTFNMPFPVYILFISSQNSIFMSVKLHFWSSLTAACQKQTIKRLVLSGLLSELIMCSRFKGYKWCCGFFFQLLIIFGSCVPCQILLEIKCDPFIYLFVSFFVHNVQRRLTILFVRQFGLRWYS